MQTIGTITCCNPRGEPRVFQVFQDEVSSAPTRAWYFSLEAVVPPDPSGEAYIASFKEIDRDLVQVETTSNQLPETYQRCGISRALIPRVATLLGRTVCSSLNPKTALQRDVGSHGGAVAFAEETLSVPALKVWERLAQDCMAQYDDTEGRFYCAPGQAAF